MTEDQEIFKLYRIDRFAQLIEIGVQNHWLFMPHCAEHDPDATSADKGKVNKQCKRKPEECVWLIEVNTLQTDKRHP